ncbi:hypothetical protein AB0K92_15860 [Streptomyces sp. NPDC052687]|uniref:hypothetical protein n=1 Tax=Streptomyces sp. NPDC052687 TaxID=3154759 RepID=UPI0034217E4B
MDSITALIVQWAIIREELGAAGRDEHPNITDHHGRVWTWWKGDLYRHCGMVWPRSFVEDGRHSLPSAQVLANPNYPPFCPTCAPAARLPLAA